MEETIEENRKDVEKETFSEEGQEDMDREEQIEEKRKNNTFKREEKRVGKEEEESKQQIKIKPRKLLNEYDKIILAIGITIIIIIAGIYFGFRGRKDNPFAFITDSDGDGYSDNNDAFIHDPSEWEDWDEDGIGHNADIYDLGDAGFRVRIFKYLEENESLDEDGRYDPYFIIYFDYEGDEDWDISIKSEVYEDTPYLWLPFSYIINVRDDLESIRFAVVVMDKDFLTDDDYIDYTDESSSTWYVHKFIPSSKWSTSFKFNGENDGVLNEKDCYIFYCIDIFKID